MALSGPGTHVEQEQHKGDLLEAVKAMPVPVWRHAGGRCRMLILVYPDGRERRGL